MPLFLSRIDDFEHLLLNLNGQWIDPTIPTMPVGYVQEEYANGLANKFGPQ